MATAIYSLMAAVLPGGNQPGALALLLGGNFGELMAASPAQTAKTELEDPKKTKRNDTKNEADRPQMPEVNKTATVIVPIPIVVPDLANFGANPKLFGISAENPTMEPATEARTTQERPSNDSRPVNPKVISETSLQELFIELSSSLTKGSAELPQAAAIERAPKSPTLIGPEASATHAPTSETTPEKPLRDVVTREKPFPVATVLPRLNFVPEQQPSNEAGTNQPPAPVRLIAPTESTPTGPSVPELAVSTLASVTRHKLEVASRLEMPEPKLSATSKESFCAPPSLGEVRSNLHAALSASGSQQTVVCQTGPEVDPVPTPQAAMHLEGMTERLAGPELRFGFASENTGSVNIATTLKDSTVSVGITAERVETASALKAEIPVLEASLRDRSLNLGEINIGSASSLSSSMYSDGQRRGRPEWLPVPITTVGRADTAAEALAESPSWVRSERNSLSLLA